MRKTILIIFASFLMVGTYAQSNDSLHSRFQDTSLLKEVTITGRKQSMQILPDRTVIHTDAIATNSGANVFELLEKSPGVSFDRNGNISLKGKHGVLVMIDGKPAQLSGEELTNWLSGINAAQVESIELIDNPPARYDAAGNGGIINIRTKKNKHKGFNGTLSLALGQGRYNKTLNTLTLNYRSGKFNFFSTLGLNISRQFTDLYAFRTYYTEDNRTAALLEQPGFFKSRPHSHSLNLGADYYIDKKTTVGFTLTNNPYNRRSSGQNSAIWMDKTGTIDSVVRTSSDNMYEMKNRSLNINARHTFNARKEITADLDYMRYSIHNELLFNNNIHGSMPYQETITGALPSAIKIITGKTDFIQRINDGLRFETGWKSSFIKTDNKALYKYLDNGVWKTDYNKSNQFLYEENIHATYINGVWQKYPWKIESGIRYEITKYHARQLGNEARKDSAFVRNYDGIFPSISSTFSADSNNSFTIHAGRRIDRPAFQALNPFVFIINKYALRSGNPFFRPQYTWNIELTHTYKNSFTTSLSYSTTKDYFSQIFYADTSGVITYTEGNLDRMTNLGLTVSTQLSPAKWWSLSGQANLNYKKIKGYVWQQLNASLTQFNMNVNNQFSFGGGWGAELSGFFQLSEQELQEITDPTGQLSAGVSKQVFNNKGTFRIVIRDIFYTQAMKGNTIFAQAHEYFSLKRDSRTATLAFTYRFGKLKKNDGRRKGGAADELRRINAPN